MSLTSLLSSMNRNLRRRSRKATCRNRPLVNTRRAFFEPLEDRCLLAVTFAPAANFAVAAGPVSVAIADVNNDSYSDIVTANSVGDNVSVLLGNGSGGFASAGNYGVGDNPQGVTVGDFNGDGMKDLAVANYGVDHVGPGTVSVLLGNGNGTFGAATSITVGRNPHSVTVGDFNGDSKADLAVANFDSASVSVLLGNGNGTFSADVQYQVGDGQLFNAGPRTVTVGDFNSDGKQDLATANYYSGNGGGVLLGNGNGTFATQLHVVSGYSFTGSVTVGDFNNDGVQDLATAGRHSTSGTVLLGNNNGTFQAPLFYQQNTGAIPQTVTAADFDGDGKQDLATSNFSTNQVKIWQGNGNGTFTGGGSYAVGTTSFFVTTGDFNGDGKIDLVNANRDANNVSVLLNTSIPPNSPPAIAVDTPAAVTVNEGSLATKTGTWSDANAGNTVTLNASIGTVTPSGTNAGGTWTWSYTPTDGPDQSQTVTITANDGAGGIATTTFALTVNNVAPTIELARDLINIDFQGDGNPTYDGLGVLGSASDTTWNALGQNGGTNLLFADGSGASGVAVSLSYVTTFANGAQSNPLLFDWTYGDFGSPSPETFTISGLSPNSWFNLAFYDGFYWQDFTVQGQPGLIASVRPDSSLGSAGAPPFPTGTYGIIYGARSDASGQITIIDTPVLGGSSGLNTSMGGLQIQSATAPAVDVQLDLADIVGGGDGTGTGGNQGINEVTGLVVTTKLQGPVPGSQVTNNYKSVSHPFIDGVFVPDGGPGGRPQSRSRRRV